MCMSHTHTEHKPRVCMHARKLVYACMRVFTYVCTRKAPCDGGCCSCACMSLMYTHSHVHTFTCTHIHMYTHSPVHTVTCTHIHMYTHAHVHAFTCAFCRHASLRLADPISPPRLPSLPPGYAYEQESPLALTSLKHMLLCKVVCVCVCVCMCMCVQGYLSV